MSSTFYFDFTSPYSYLAWERLLISNSININKMSIKPVLVGKIISEIGGIGPALIPQKRDYLFKDCLRKSISRNIKFRSPARLPFNPLDILRMAISLENSKIQQIEFITQVFRFGWRDGEDFENFEALKAYIVKNTSITVQQYDQLGENKESRKTLKSNIASAIGQGVFGVPSIIYNDELFWGEDSFDYLEKMIEDKDILESKIQEFNRFKNIIAGEIL